MTSFLPNLFLALGATVMRMRRKRLFDKTLRATGLQMREFWHFGFSYQVFKLHYMQTLLPFILASSILNFTIISHHFSPNRSSCCSWRQYSFYTITASLYQASSLGAVSPLHACFVMILQALHYLALYTFHPHPSLKALSCFLILLFTFTLKRSSTWSTPAFARL